MNAFIIIICGLVLFATAIVHGDGAPKVHPETKLLADLLGPPYDARARPPFQPSHPVQVSFRLNLRQIYDVSERAQTVSILATSYQEWVDPRIQWNPSDYDGLDGFSIFYTFVWIPDTALYNTVDMYDPNVEDRANANVKSDGGNGTGSRIQVIFNTRYTIGCRFNMRYFPFDVQTCTFMLGSWTYDQGQINYTLVSDTVTTEDYRESDEWSLISFGIISKSEKYVCCKNPYQVLYANVVMKRKALYYIFNLVLPTVIINIIASFGLFASAGNADNRHDKLQIGITTLLSYCILLLTVSDQIPKGSSAIPLISWFFFSIMVQNAVKMYLSIFLSYPERRKVVMAIIRSIKDKILRWVPGRRKTPVHIPSKKKLDELLQADDEDRTPELVCLWISVAVLGLITVAMFAVAYNR